MPLFTFLTNTKCDFEGRKSYENVLLLLRRHWFVIVIKLVGFLIVSMLPIVLYFVVRNIVPEILDGYSGDIFWLILAIFYLFLWYAIFYSVTMYLLDIWIVSDHRIIDSEQHGFFSRTVAEIHLAKIQDISVSISGIIPTFLDYGNLEVQSAGASEKFFFKQIPHPNQVREIIMEAHNKYIETHPNPNETEIHEQ